MCVCVCSGTEARGVFSSGLFKVRVRQGCVVSRDLFHVLKDEGVRETLARYIIYK